VCPGGGKGAQKGDEKSQQCHKYFFQYSAFSSHDLRFEHGDTKLASCPGRHLISLRPWVCHSQSHYLSVCRNEEKFERRCRRGWPTILPQLACGFRSKNRKEIVRQQPPRCRNFSRGPRAAGDAGSLDVPWRERRICDKSKRVRGNVDETSNRPRNVVVLRSVHL